MIGLIGGVASYAHAVPPSVEMVMEESLSPFSSWGNVVNSYGAVGNGIADDTAAIQNCLSAVAAGTQQVCYFPAGTYKVTSTLYLNAPASGAYYAGRLIGADPATTKIQWAGAAGGTMLVQNGGFGADYERLTWDGAGTAQIGVAQWWDHINVPVYGGSAQHQDEVFQNMAIGINAGREGANYGWGDSEGQIRRVSFINNSFAGLDTGSFNALDWWVWESSFVNCGRGYSNNWAMSDSGVTGGAGASHIYRSNFSGSTVSDYDIGNTGGFTLNHNFSTGAARFLQTAFSGENDARLIVEGNRVVNLASGVVPIYVADAGPLVMVDNQFGNQGSNFFFLSDQPGLTDNDALSIANTTYGSWPTTGQDTQRILNINNSVAQPGSISTTPLSLPATPSVVSHAVFEVPAGASAATIQTAINNAAASSDTQAIVHFGGTNSWNVATTLTIPVHSHLQLVGDGWGSILNWTGSSGGTMIQITCPAKVTMRELGITGTSTITPVSASGCDSLGSRIEIVGSSVGGLSASNLSLTRVSLQANSGVINGNIDPTQTSVNLVNDTSVVSIGSGGFGTIAMTGSNSNFVLENIWTETVGSGGTPGNSMFNIASGTFTLLGAELALGSHSGAGLQAVPPIIVNGSTATQSYIGIEFNLGGVANGVGAEVENEVAGTKAYFYANDTLPGEHNWFSRPGPDNGAVSFVLNRQDSGECDDNLICCSSSPGCIPDPNGYAPDGQMANLGNTSNLSVLSGWEQARTLIWDANPYTPPSGSADIRLYRVKADGVGSVVITN